MYYIYFKRANGGKFTVGSDPFLSTIDKQTTKCTDRNSLLANTTQLSSLPLDLSEKAYIWKETEDENIDFGEVLYSDYADINNVEENKEKILIRFNNSENMNSFLGKYLEISYGKGTNEEIIKELKRIFELLNEKNDKLFSFIQGYFRILIEEMFKDYESYRFAYLASKAIPKKKVKCITKNIYGKRKTH